MGKRRNHRLMVAWMGGLGKWVMTDNECGISLWADENGLELDSHDGCTTLQIANGPLNYTL